MAKRAWTVGVDFGGTAVKVGLVMSTGRVHRMMVIASRRLATPAAFIDGIARTVRSLARSVGVQSSQLCGVGIGAPGPVDVARGVIHVLVNVPGWHEVALRRPLERRLKCPCFIDNDVNLFTLGEWRFGAGRGARALVGLTLGTGVGGGFVCDGALYRGVSGAAGELGHMIIRAQGWRCACGARGCLEAYVGTKGILRMTRQAVRKRPGVLRTMAHEAQGRLTPELVSRAAQRGDPAARAIWERVGASLGIGMVSVINAVNPDRIVIGGGVAKAWRFFAPAMTQTVRAQAMAIAQRAARIVRARLGAEAGVIGAAVLVWQHGER